jgi:hypothetical protein
VHHLGQRTSGGGVVGHIKSYPKIYKEKMFSINLLSFFIFIFCFIVDRLICWHYNMWQGDTFNPFYFKLVYSHRDRILSRAVLTAGSPVTISTIQSTFFCFLFLYSHQFKTSWWCKGVNWLISLHLNMYLEHWKTQKIFTLWRR